VTDRPNESVWDYPRPPAAELMERHIRVIAGGEVVAETDRPVKVMETSHPPVYYIPAEDVRMEFLSPSAHRTVCEYKGLAGYYSLDAGHRHVSNAAWFYADPLPGYEILKGHVAFYPWAVDEATVDGEVVRPQEGHFYGGWITGEIEGPFKGGSGTLGW
jgi:uncharacterized protein (DUF427 family)